MWNQHCSILSCSTTLLATLLCLGGYEQRCTELLKVLHKCCKTDILRSTLSLGHCAPSGAMRIYQSNPSLLCYNILILLYFTINNNNVIKDDIHITDSTDSNQLSDTRHHMASGWSCVINKAKNEVDILIFKNQLLQYCTYLKQHVYYQYTIPLETC